MTLCEGLTGLRPMSYPRAMSNLDLMRDPFYAQLMFVIECAICKADEAAQKKGVRLTDSNIKSALNKARRMMPEKVIAPVESLERREDFVEELARSIAANREVLLEETEGAEGRIAGVSPGDWGKAISAVEASLKVRRRDEPGSRDYLDFVRRFVEEERL
jgi:hypothetical protein